MESILWDFKVATDVTQNMSEAHILAWTQVSLQSPKALKSCDFKMMLRKMRNISI